MPKARILWRFCATTPGRLEPAKRLPEAPQVTRPARPRHSSREGRSPLEPGSPTACPPRPPGRDCAPAQGKGPFPLRILVFREPNRRRAVKKNMQNRHLRLPSNLARASVLLPITVLIGSKKARVVSFVVFFQFIVGQAGTTQLVEYIKFFYPNRSACQVFGDRGMSRKRCFVAGVPPFWLPINARRDIRVRSSTHKAGGFWSTLEDALGYGEDRRLVVAAFTCGPAVAPTGRRRSDAPVAVRRNGKPWPCSSSARPAGSPASRYPRRSYPEPRPRGGCAPTGP